MNKLLNMDIDKIVAAVVADDPDAAAVADDLAHSLREMQAGQFARQTEITLSPVAQTRHQTGLSQEKFTVLLGISANTLKSWEQQRRQPSGAARTLLHLLHKHPELVHEIRQ
ncbi:helix-turn-helix domain-containing protein [Kingella kingae]|uniref:helix-turn-helix domain-containing protein n=2 Tax=Kingella kingae TaxID=504 RepID=UPI0004254CCB|nr:type II toxin-antitoxin system MqsA family antitoxin [Kingella kingae]